MKRSGLLIILLIISSRTFLCDSGITRGPDVGEIYFIAPTRTQPRAIYHSTDFGETATCMDSTLNSNILFNSITADLTPGIVYATDMSSLYISYNYGQEGSWMPRSGDVSYVHSGSREGFIYSGIGRHSENYGLDFIDHSCNGIFAAYRASEIDNTDNIGYCVVSDYSGVDSLWVLISTDNFNNFEIQHEFNINGYAQLTRGYEPGEIYLITFWLGDGDGQKLRYSNDYGQTWELKNTFNCPFLPIEGIVGGRQPGELFINVEYFQYMSTIKHSYIYHSLDHGETFTIYNPFSEGPEARYANFETNPLSGTAPLTVQFTDTSSGENISYWEWDFDNDDIIDSYEQNPVYCYPDSGIYQASLSLEQGLSCFGNELYVERTIQVTSNNSSYEDQIEVIGVKLSNYPNPFNPVTTISYELPDNIENPAIEIYNLRGQRVTQLRIKDEGLRTGSVVWDGSGFASGIYFYKLNIEDSPIKKMILLK